MTLLEAGSGVPLRILEIPDDTARAQCIRFGIGEGATLDEAERLSGGPVVVRCGNQEVCVGRALAKRILVEPATDGCGAGRCGQGAHGDARGGAHGGRRRWRGARA